MQYIILFIIALFGIAIVSGVLYSILSVASALFKTSIKNVVICASIAVVLIVAIPFLSDGLYRFFFGNNGNPRDSIEERYQETLKAES